MERKVGTVATAAALEAAEPVVGREEELSIDLLRINVGWKRCKEKTVHIKLRRL